MAPFTGHEVLIAEAARTPFGKSHPELDHTTVGVAPIITGTLVQRVS